jgi:hypothetical protein
MAATTPMPDIAAPTREEVLVPASPNTPQPRKRRCGVKAFGLLTILGLGVAGGANLHRLVDLDQAAPWLEHNGSILRSGFEAARNEIGSRIASFTSKPVSVAQASQEATSSATPNNDIIERAVADLSLRVDQVRAAHDGSARDRGQGIERIRNAAEQNHRELVAKLVQLTERVERMERQAAAAAAPAVAHQPVVPPTTPSPAKPVAKTVPKPVHDTKPVAKTVPQPTPDTKAKVSPKQTSTEIKPDGMPGMDVNGIANWTVRDVFDGTAVLEGPRGVIDVTVGDTVPGIGRVQAITRSGRRWVVATTKGVITPRLPRTSPEFASEPPRNFW